MVMFVFWKIRSNLYACWYNMCKVERKCVKMSIDMFSFMSICRIHFRFRLCVSDQYLTLVPFLFQLFFLLSIPVSILRYVYNKTYFKVNMVCSLWNWQKVAEILYEHLQVKPCLFRVQCTLQWCKLTKIWSEKFWM